MTLEFKPPYEGAMNVTIGTHESNLFVSYLADPQPTPFDIIIGPPEGPETALCIDDVWYILKGDFRPQYLEAYPKGKEACLEVYNKNKAEFRSKFSTD